MKRFYKFLFFSILSIALGSCGPDKDPFEQEGVDLYGKDLAATLTAYNDMKTGLDHLHKQGAPAMYVDFSAGMFTAFGTPVIRDLMSQCFNTVLAKRFEVYRLSEGQVRPIPVSNSTQLGQVVGDPKQYLDVRAPIQAAVEKIVAAKNDALLITDFEEWQQDVEVTSTAYLKIAFSQWLKAGNSISFFIADYREGTVAKHIYFTVFTYGKAYGDNLIDKLRQRLSVLPVHFDLNTDAYLLSTGYAGPNTGGIFHDLAGNDDQSRNVLDLEPGYINGLLQHKPFEYYPLGINWASVAETKKDLQVNDLFRKLYVDLHNTDSYDYGDFEVKVYDVTNDYERYAKSLELRKHRPRIVKGKDGEDEISDQENDAIALACYKPDGTVKPGYLYQPENTPVLNDLFVLNKVLFDNTLKTDKSKTEIAIAFAPGFAMDKIINPGGLMKIVLNIRQAVANTSNPVLEKFKWINKNGVPNVGLYESVKSTLDELKSADKTIYTYYIKTTEQ
jgi:hypothetical protein